MPYKIEGNSIFVKRGDKWTLLKTHKSHDKALAHFRALQVNVIKKEKPNEPYRS